MKIYSWNVNGIRAVWNKGMLQSFVQQHQPDILCLQETKAHQEQSEVDLPEYKEYWFSAEKKGYSGTAIFSKQAAINILHGMPEGISEKYQLNDIYGDTTKEGRIICAEYQDFYVVSVYTPNAKDDLSRIAMRTHWDPAFLEYMTMLESRKPVIFCGDFNVAHTEDDLANPKPNMGKKGFTIEERNGFQAFVDAGFVDSFRVFTKGNGHYSWWSHFANARARNVGWRIDYIMLSPKLRPRLVKAMIHADVMGSDHCPISVTLK